MTAKTKDGKVVVKEEKHYMLHATDSRGNADKMLYGAHLKAGLLKDTTFMPLQTRTETFDIKMPEGFKGEVEVLVQLRMQKAANADKVGKGKGVASTIMFEGNQTIKF